MADGGGGAGGEAAVRQVIGLVLMAALAYWAGLPRFRRWERRLHLAQAISAGFPFVLIGMIAQVAGVLPESLVAELGSVLRIALGWTGFLVGLRFQMSAIQRVPRELAAFSLCRFFVTFLLSAGAAVVVFRLFEAEASLSHIRHGIVLGLGACVTSFVVPRLLGERGAPPESVGRVRRVLQFEELSALMALLLVDAYFRSPESGMWPLPGGAWVLLTLGLGVAAGLFANGVLRLPNLKRAETLVLALGSVCFSAGAAGYLQISPLVVGFIAGAVVSALPGKQDQVLLETLAPLDHALTLVFLVVIGTYLDVRAPLGWLLLAALLPARLLGRWVGTWFGARVGHLAPDGEASPIVTLSPVGSLGIAIVVNAHVLTPTGAMPAIALALVGAALLTEVLVQFTMRVPANGGG